MKLGTSTCLFVNRRFGKTELPYIEQTRLCAEAGFRVLDLNCCGSTKPARNNDLAADDWEARIDALGNEAAKLGVSFTQSHAPFNVNMFTYGRQPDADYMKLLGEMTRRCIIASGRLGVKWVVVHPYSDTVNTEYDNEIQMKTNLEFYLPILEQAIAAGTGIAVENMGDADVSRWRRSYGANADELNALIDAVDDPAFGVCWDFGHARMMMEDQPRHLELIGKRLKATHVQDNNGKRDSHLIPFVGGNIKWEDIMPVLKKIGYEGDFMYECHSFMTEIPDPLRPAAGRLAYEFGLYCMELYDKAQEVSL